MENTIVARKHWVNYILPGFIVLIGLSFASTRSLTSLFFSVILLLVGVIKIVQLTSVKWTFTGEYVIIQRGVLPWAKTFMEIPVYDIYESIVYNGMFGHFLAYGNIVIRRTEGVTSQLSDKGMVNAKILSGKINSAVRQAKVNKNTVVVSVAGPADKSISDELKHLVELKAAGHITQEEYENLKNKLISR